MAPQDYTHFAIARFVLETKTPLSISSGQADGVHDAALVRDANGLPMIPGTALAGVLRHLHARLNPHDDPDINSSTERLFGYQHRDTGTPSRLSVSHGVLLDAHGQALEGLATEHAQQQRLASDPLLKRAVDVDAAILRDRVRIAARGAAADQGLFDRTILPAGYRFAAELCLWTNAAQREEWPQLLALLHHPLLRLGGGTRAGLGAISVVSLHQRLFAVDLKRGGRREDVTALTALKPSLTSTAGLKAWTPATPLADPQLAMATLTLKPRHFWRIGGGIDAVNKQKTRGDKAPKLVPKQEVRVRWNKQLGALNPGDVLIPASSIKGVLAHRSSFHAHRLAQRWAEDQTQPLWETDRQHCPEAQTLFGLINDDDSDTGHVGRVVIDDTWIKASEVDVELITHNAIDRFSGGVRNRMLFTEQVVIKGQFTLQLMLDLRGLSADDPALQALQAALADLVEGRLAIGAKSSTGHGYLQGTVTWQAPAAFRQTLSALGDAP